MPRSYEAQGLYRQGALLEPHASHERGRENGLELVSVPLVQGLSPDKPGRTENSA